MQKWEIAILSKDKKSYLLLSFDRSGFSAQKILFQ